MEELGDQYRRQEGQRKEGSWVEETQQPPVAKVDVPGLPQAKRSLWTRPKCTSKERCTAKRLISGDKERVVELLA